MVRLKRCHWHSGFVCGCRLLEDLEEVQTDKVSMEYLLREKLERLVQSEIEARVARMHQVKQTLRVLHDTTNPRCEAFQLSTPSVFGLMFADLWTFLPFRQRSRPQGTFRSSLEGFGRPTSSIGTTV